MKQKKKLIFTLSMDVTGLTTDEVAKVASDVQSELSSTAKAIGLSYEGDHVENNNLDLFFQDDGETSGFPFFKGDE